MYTFHASFSFFVSGFFGKLFFKIRAAMAKCALGLGAMWMRQMGKLLIGPTRRVLLKRVKGSPSLLTELCNILENYTRAQEPRAQKWFPWNLLSSERCEAGEEGKRRGF
jgi:hypothetical protein